MIRSYTCWMILCLATRAVSTCSGSSTVSRLCLEMSSCAICPGVSTNPPSWGNPGLGLTSHERKTNIFEICSVICARWQVISRSWWSNDKEGSCLLYWRPLSPTVGLVLLTRSLVGAWSAPRYLPSVRTFPWWWSAAQCKREILKRFTLGYGKMGKIRWKSDALH